MCFPFFQEKIALPAEKVSGSISFATSVSQEVSAGSLFSREMYKLEHITLILYYWPTQMNNIAN